ncbi:MAG: adenylate/guanylate cyclase domain-containing protein [Candidatus Riflebacteria bacterium]|nr:adenylate/guanylate cyclase domain-containing protein [Candidatus Riflebacteria bacterium]
MKRFLTGWEAAFLWLLLVPLPWFLFQAGWEAGLAREETQRRLAARTALRTEAESFLEHLTGISFIDHAVGSVSRHLGFTEDSSPASAALAARIDDQALERARTFLTRETGAVPWALAILGPEGKPCRAWVNPAHPLTPAPDRGQAELAGLVAEYLRYFGQGLGEPAMAGFRQRLNQGGYRLFGDDANIGGLGSRVAFFVQRPAGLGHGYWTIRQGPRVDPGRPQPRQSSLFQVFLGQDLSPARILKAAVARASPGFTRRLRWLQPSSLPRFEEVGGRLVYLQALDKDDFHWNLTRRRPDLFRSGQQPVLTVDIDLAELVSPRRRWGALLPAGFAIPAGLITLLLFRGVWLGGHLGGGLRGNLGAGFTLCLAPWLAGLVLFLAGWLDLRAQAIPASVAEFLARRLELLDQRLAHIHGLENRLLESRRPLFQRLAERPTTADREALARVGATTNLDFSFLFTAGGQKASFQDSAPTDPNLVRLFQGFAIQALQEAGNPSVPSSRPDAGAALLWRTFVDQFIDIPTLGRTMAAEGKLQRSPFGNPQQWIHVFFLRDRRPSHRALAMAVSLGGFLFAERRLKTLLETRILLEASFAGYHLELLLYKFHTQADRRVGTAVLGTPADHGPWNANRPVAEATLADLVGKTLHGEEEGARSLTVTRPLQADFFIAAGLARDGIDRRREAGLVVGSLGGVLLLFLAGLVWASTFLLTRPLLAFLEVTRRAARGEFTWRLDLPGRDEFGQMAGVFNQMAGRLIERQRLSRFVSEDTLSALAGDETAAVRRGGSLVETTILVSDIRSFTTLSEEHPPEVVVEMLNGYFTVMEECITAGRGVIVSFIGDAILAHFPDAQGQAADGPARAVEAAWRMRAALDQWNARRLEAGLFTIRTGIGIATGPALTGVVGSQTGRLAQVVLGEPVDRATRLEAAAKQARASGIFVDPDTATLVRTAWNILPVTGSAEGEIVGPR